MPFNLFEKQEEMPQQLKNFDEAKNTLQYRNPEEKRWLWWQESPGIYAIVNFRTRLGAKEGFTMQYCYCYIAENKKTIAELTPSRITTYDPDETYQTILKKNIITHAGTHEAMQDLIEKEFGKDQGFYKQPNV